MFEACTSPGSTLSCERGTFCDANKLCAPLVERSLLCNSSAECLSGECVLRSNGVKTCAANSRCYYPVQL